MSDLEEKTTSMPKIDDIKIQLEACMQIMERNYEYKNYLGVMSSAENVVKLSYLLSVMTK